MNNSDELSLLRLYLIRALFMLMCVGTLLTQLPSILNRTVPFTLMHGVGASMLLAMAALSALGIRYPVQMMPILFWELLWKSVWLLVFALPLWRAGQMDAETMESVQACLLGVVICPVVMPWRFVWRRYVVNSGDRWR